MRHSDVAQKNRAEGTQFRQKELETADGPRTSSVDPLLFYVMCSTIYTVVLRAWFLKTYIFCL